MAVADTYWSNTDTRTTLRTVSPRPSQRTPTPTPAPNLATYLDSLAGLKSLSDDIISDFKKNNKEAQKSSTKETTTRASTSSLNDSVKLSDTTSSIDYYSDCPAPVSNAATTGPSAVSSAPSDLGAAKRYIAGRIRMDERADEAYLSRTKECGLSTPQMTGSVSSGESQVEISPTSMMLESSTSSPPASLPSAPAVESASSSTPPPTSQIVIVPEGTASSSIPTPVTPSSTLPKPSSSISLPMIVASGTEFFSSHASTAPSSTTTSSIVSSLVSPLDSTSTSTIQYPTPGPYNQGNCSTTVVETNSDTDGISLEIWIYDATQNLITHAGPHSTQHSTHAMEVASKLEDGLVYDPDTQGMISFTLGKQVWKSDASNSNQVPGCSGQPLPDSISEDWVS